MKSLLVLLALTVSVTAMAKDDRYSGSFTKNDGGTIIRIEVGSERDTDSRQMIKRMVQLERAVRELQNRVYDLEDDSRPQTREERVYTCVLSTSFDLTFIGKGSTEIEAKAQANKACQAAGASFCGVHRIVGCESSIEIVRR